MAKVLEIFLLFSSFSVLARAGDTCTTDLTYDYWSGTYTYEYTYCSYGCCGTSPYEYCCSYESVSYESVDDNLYIWIVIVPSVVGSILFLSCVIACICCAVKKKSRPGMLVQPMQPGVAMISGTNPGPSYGYPQPGAYQQQTGYQPPPGYHPGYQQPIAYQNKPTENPAFPPEGNTGNV